ncbi:glycerophosphodiester phosphodiesterase family protein [Herbiconiux sp. SYSU D00978]|uniref:glycerophosphodiester phosphodiesterase family protein n=1 Tax=Herbiconiux sp. SYSU D00978 TaxID=2812562 RepID=UPI001A95C10F|nr:glycerophosphodiester phosphodiesterase family protein [Herbiconiux sp. SYSU D00978]
MTPPRPLVIAHRGASGYRPEHSRAAYDLAVTLGADAIEPDIVPTRDGVLVLRHENEIGGTTDVSERAEFADRRTTKTVDGVELTGWFTEDFDWAELKTLTLRERLPGIRPANTTFPPQPMQRLADLLAILDDAERSVGLVAELKHPTYFDSVGLPLGELFAAELAEAGWAADPRLTVECFERGVLRDIRTRGVVAPIVYLQERRGSAPDLVASLGDDAPTYEQERTDEALAALAGEVDGISVDKGVLLADVNPPLVPRAHAAGLSVFTWTLRPENRFLAKRHRTGEPADFGRWAAEFAEIMDTGVDGVFADHPDLALAVRGGLGRAEGERPTGDPADVGGPTYT